MESHQRGGRLNQFIAGTQGGHSGGRDPEPVMSVDSERAHGFTAVRAAREWTRADGAPVRVLIVDDEVSVTEVLAMAFRDDGWDVAIAGSGHAAMRAAQEFHPDAVVLDVVLPDCGGMEVLRRLRAHSPQVCVLFLSARAEAADRIAGISAGADDYLTKPFSLEEVVARLRGLLRRSGLAQARDGDHHLAVADLTMYEAAYEVRRAGDLIDLTPTEFEVLRLLMRNSRRVPSKAQILDRVWDDDFGVQEHVVELCISNLRRKIDAGRKPLIHTVRGVGYILKPPLR
jgi:two-component system, OmpR family, response regulator